MLEISSDSIKIKHFYVRFLPHLLTRVAVGGVQSGARYKRCLPNMSQPPMTISVGSLLAILATLCWASNFIVPYVNGGFAVSDVLVLRFLFSGLIGVISASFNLRVLGKMTAKQRWAGLGLGIISSTAYGSFIAASAVTAGPAVVAALVGAVPVIQALMGNLGGEVRWSRLIVPITLLGIGIALVNVSALIQPLGVSPVLGTCFAVAAVLCWLLYSLINQLYLPALPRNGVAAWVSLNSIGGGGCALLIAPWLWHNGVFTLSSANIFSAEAGKLIVCALIISFLCSWLGTFLWNHACRRLPSLLSGQLIAFEAVFAMLLGFAFLRQMPAFQEVLGILMVVISAILSVRVILAPRQTVGCKTTASDRG